MGEISVSDLGTNANAGDFITAFKQFQAGRKSFADEMREKGIHVGLGANPFCVNCRKPWPCPDSVIVSP